MSVIENTNSDYIVECIIEQFKMIKNSENILNLGGEMISDVLNKNKINFYELKNESKLLLDDYIDKICIEDSWNSEFYDLEKKYDLIILNNMLEKVKNPIKLLENLSNYLSDNGTILATVKNFSNSQTTFQIFNGTFLKNNYNIYDLDSLVLFLSKVNFSIIELHRIKKILSDSSNNLDKYRSHLQIFELLNTNPESIVISYVFRIKKNNSDNFKIRNWISTFPKNYFLDSLTKKFESYNNLEQSLKDKDDVILGLENSLNETKFQINDVKNSKFWNFLYNFFKKKF